MLPQYTEKVNQVPCIAPGILELNRSEGGSSFVKQNATAQVILKWILAEFKDS